MKSNGGKATLITVVILIIIVLVLGGIIFFKWYNDKMKEDNNTKTNTIDNTNVQNSIGTNETDNTNTQNNVATNNGVENKEITLTEAEKAQIMAMMEYDKYIDEKYSEDGFEAQKLTDERLAFIGMFLMIRGEDESIAHREKEVFEKTIYDFFGVTIKKAEELELGVMEFENGEYVIGAFGDEGRPSHEYEMLKVYDLGNDSIKVEFRDTAIETLGEDEGKQTKYKIESVFKKVPESKWGYNYISCKVIESNI